MPPLVVETYYPQPVEMLCTRGLDHWCVGDSYSVVGEEQHQDARKLLVMVNGDVQAVDQSMFTPVVTECPPTAPEAESQEPFAPDLSMGELGHWAEDLQAAAEMLVAAIIAADEVSEIPSGGSASFSEEDLSLFAASGLRSVFELRLDDAIQLAQDVLEGLESMRLSGDLGTVVDVEGAGQEPEEADVDGHCDA